MARVCWRSIFAGVLALGWLGTSRAAGQLYPDQVLVVYDSRVADSRAVAEYYAGSRAVPGGSGNLPGARRGVRVVDLAPIAPATPGPDITYTQFINGYRNPLRQWLNSNDPRGRIRCLVLTKGLAHRIDDTDFPNVGENFGTVSGGQIAVVAEVFGGDATYASVDSELTLLQQNLSNGEAGAPGDSFADGAIVNPFFQQVQGASTTGAGGVNQGIASWSTATRRNATTFNPTISTSPGLYWSSASAPTLSPGDVYLVCRLDGQTLADVIAIIDRARADDGRVNTSSAIFILDESRSNGVADTAPNGELDNTDLNTTVRPIWRGDDYELTRNLIQTDGRFDPTGIRYDAGAYPSNYYFGPREVPGITLPLTVTDPITYLASECGSSDGTPTGNPKFLLPQSFFWGPMGYYGSIESFNARDFGGKGTLFGQSQISLAAQGGATFAIGHVWEPFAATIPDNNNFVRRFYLGTMSFAEAAWSSIPVLSWQHVVLGDPLARVTRSIESADEDDPRVNINDLYEWERQPVDINRAGGANNTDRRLLESTIRPGQGVLDMIGRQR
ncbi:MAG: hypothetical protein MUE97_03390 [Phycisphaerales bacterium]|nr:hypothetical protein [Phycisphaerales bacterium]